MSIRGSVVSSNIDSIEKTMITSLRHGFFSADSNMQRLNMNNSARRDDSSERCIWLVLFAATSHALIQKPWEISLMCDRLDQKGFDQGKVSVAHVSIHSIF